MPSEIAQLADFSQIRYAQCWEDADILLQALNLQPGQTCLSIISAGDNTLALLTRQPKKVLAIDFNPAQIACLELRVAAYRTLNHAELLRLIGASLATADERIDLYWRCHQFLSPTARFFWENRLNEIAKGIGNIGKFEKYLALFRKYILPLMMNQKQRELLFTNDSLSDRLQFYQRFVETGRSKLLFRLFFSQYLLGKLGRDPQFFQYVEGSISQHLWSQTKQALIMLNPAENPYLQWIMTGKYKTALPLALRPENFNLIRNNLDCLEWRCISLEDFVNSYSNIDLLDSFNLSNIFEYMSEANYDQVLRQLWAIGNPGARLVYWNLLTPRRRPDCLAKKLVSLESLAAKLHQEERVFFYSALIIEEIEKS